MDNKIMKLLKMCIWPTWHQNNMKGIALINLALKFALIITTIDF